MITHTWKTIGLTAILATALTAVSARAADSDAPADKKADSAASADTKKADSDSPLDVRKLDEIQKQLGEVQKSLANLEAIKKELEGFRTNTNVTVQKALADIMKVEDQVGRLQKDLDSLRSQTNGPPSRTSYFQATSPALGSIRLINTFSGLASVIVNGRATRLAPGETRVVEVPAGTFNYEVLVDGFGSVQPLSNRVLEPSKTFTIYVYPR